MNLISTVDEVQLLAEHLDMTQVLLVPGLHGRWHTPGAELAAQAQWAHLVVAVTAFADDARDEWTARFSTGTPVDVIAWNINRAKRPGLEVAS